MSVFGLSATTSSRVAATQSSFGASTPGPQVDHPGAGYKFGTVYPLAGPGTVIAFRFYARGEAASQAFTPVIYTTDANANPTTLIAQGAGVTVAAGMTARWFTSVLPAIAVPPGSYLLGLVSGPTTQGAGLFFTAATGRSNWNANAYPTASRTWGALNQSVGTYSFAVDYTLGVATTTVPTVPATTTTVASVPTTLPPVTTTTTTLGPATDAGFARVIVDGYQVVNGHKPKAIGDVNGDGYNDIVTFTLWQGLFWYEYPSWTKHKISNGGDGEQAQAADVNSDGAVDVLVGGIGLPARWYENPRDQGKDPATTTWVQHVIGGGASHDLEVGDFDGDGKVDVATQDAVFMQGTPTSWTALDNAHFPGRAGAGTSLGDVNRDGRLDLLDASNNQLVWYENPLGSGHLITDVWARHVIGPGFVQDSIAVADLNNDGRPDVLLANEYGTGGLQWFEAPADPRTVNWPAHMIDSTVNWVHQSAIMVGDIDADGTVDVAVAEQEQSATKRVAVYYSVARDGSAWSPQIVATTGGHNPKLGDIGRDGTLDILNANHGWSGAPNPVELFRNTRAQPLPPPPPTTTTLPTTATTTTTTTPPPTTTTTAR